MGAALFPLTVAQSVARIRAYEPELCCYVNTRLDDALAAAPTGGALRGVPYGLKDEYDAPPLPTTGGSYRHRDRRPDRKSAPCRAFDEAGAVLIGKTNLSDMGLTPEATSFVGGATKNPFDRTRTSGGSSGGSAAAVAYGLHAFDWGTDIGGSIRLPAAFCGVLGLRLSHATWPIQELFPAVPPAMAWMCGQGPFTRTTAQMRAVLAVAAPHMKKGETRPFELRKLSLWAPLAGVWPTFARDAGAILRSAFDLPIDTATSLPSPSELLSINAAVWCSHFEDLLDSDPSISLRAGLGGVLSAAVLRGKLGDRRFHPITAELLLLIVLGRLTIFRDKEKALARAFGVRDALRALWDEGHVIVMPVTVHPPPKILRSNWTTKLLAYTVAGNLADATGLAIPFGTFDGRLPRAIQLLGPPGSEDVLLGLADRIIAKRDAEPTLTQRPVEVTDPPSRSAG